MSLNLYSRYVAFNRSDGRTLILGVVIIAHHR